jgi:hypothetical protein
VPVEHDPEKHVLDPIGDGHQFSEKIMLKQKTCLLPVLSARL